MRIAVLTNDYPPKIRGGAGKIAEVQVRILEEAGHQVRVWHHGFGTSHLSLPRRFFRHLKDLKPRKEIVEEIIGWKPEILLTHNFTGCGFGTPREVQKHGVRWIHVLHDVQLFDPSGQVRDTTCITLWQRLWSYLRQQTLGVPNLVLSPTQWLLNEHIRREFFRNTQTEILPNPGPAIHQKQRTVHAPMRLLFVGRLTKQKGADFLLEMLSALVQPFEIHLVGEGPLTHEFGRYRFAVKLHGYLDASQILHLMDEMDTLLVPSQIAENQPTVILEAASVGLPVIASDIGGIRETLGEAGMICPADRPDAWRAAIDETRAKFQSISNKMYELGEIHESKRYAQRFLSLLKSNR